jgi:hypothetical protein
MGDAGRDEDSSEKAESETVEKFSHAKFRRKEISGG